MSEQNKSLIRSYVETWNRGDLQKLSEYWSPNMVHHTRTKSHGLEEVKNIVGSFMNAFPDLRWKIDDIVAEGDRVVTRMTAQATNTGSYMGLPATGKKITCAVMGIARVDDGKIAEHWGVTDELAMMAQLGLLPEEFLVAMA
jgi:steroid delta-isomerase-like uncharacterized protein